MNVRPDEVLLTHGSAEAIRATIEAEATKNTVLVQPELTYGDGADVAKRNNIPVKNVKMGPNWSIDLAALRKVATAEAKKHRVLVYLVNPNNPTSTIADSNEIFNWIKSQPKNTFFILDEAYAEFVNDPSFKSCNRNSFVRALTTWSSEDLLQDLRYGRYAFGLRRRRRERHQQDS